MKYFFLMLCFIFLNKTDFELNQKWWLFSFLLILLVVNILSDKRLLFPKLQKQPLKGTLTVVAIISTLVIALWGYLGK